jgi:hypothetical protein
MKGFDEVGLRRSVSTPAELRPPGITAPDAKEGILGLHPPAATPASTTRDKIVPPNLVTFAHAGSNTIRAMPTASVPDGLASDQVAGC